MWRDVNSPCLCHQILQRRSKILRSKKEYLWAVLNAIVIFIVTLDMTFEIFRNYYFFPHSVVFVFEVTVVIICALNCIYHTYVFLRPKFEPPFPVPAAWKDILSIPSEGEDSKYWKIVSEGNEVSPYKRSSFFQVGQNFLHENYWKTYKSSGSPKDAMSLHSTSPQPRRLTAKQALARDFEPHVQTPDQVLTYLYKFERQKDIEQRIRLLENRMGSTSPDRSRSSFGAIGYQVSPKTPLSLDADPPNHCSDNVWTKQRVSEQMLNLWCERLKMWICQTVIVGLVNEINSINKKLDESGFPQLKIGEVNIFTLKQVAIEKWEALPQLLALIPYLEVSMHQEYVIQRLKDLASGGSMRSYKWDSGGFDAKTPWSKDLPCDSTLVMHLFCTYMDSLMTFDTATAKKKFFTNNCFKQIPYKPDLQEGKHYIYQSKRDPPHYSVVIDDEIYELPKGQNNLFYAILLYLHYIKTKQNGVLGQVNLGTSGLNIVWVLDW